MPPRVAPPPLIATRSLALVRWRARAPRVLLVVAVFVLSALGLRALLRSESQPVVPRVQATSRPDLESEAFAEEFARAYLTWDAGRPDDRERAVSQYVSQELDPGAGLRPPPDDRERVWWVRALRDERHGDDRLLI